MASMENTPPQSPEKRLELDVWVKSPFSFSSYSFGSGGVVGTYADPYLSEGMVPSNGQVIQGPVGDGLDGNDWQARKYDERGDLIVQEGPYVPTPVVEN